MSPRRRSVRLATEAAGARCEAQRLAGSSVKLEEVTEEGGALERCLKKTDASHQPEGS